MYNKKGLKPNTHIGVNLKTLLRKDQQAKTGKNYVGVLSRDVLCDEFLYDEHFTFIEMPPKPPVKHAYLLPDAMMAHCAPTSSR